MLLNALYRDRDVALAWEAFVPEFERLCLQRDVHGSYTVWEYEESLLENLDLLLREIEASSREHSTAAALQRLEPALEGASSLMRQLLGERRRHALAEDECLNDTLLACAARLRGAASAEAVRQRVALSLDRVDCLCGRIKVFDQELTAAFRIELEQGLAGLRLSLLELASGEVSQEALARATRQALHADVFQEWEADWQRRAEQTFCRYAIPRVGADLEDALGRGRELDRSLWALGVRRLRRVVFPALERHWEEQRASTLLTVSADQVLAPVDLGLERLRSALEGLTDPERSATQVLDALESSLEALSEAFESFERARLGRDHLSPSLANYYDAAQGLLAGTLADLHLLRLLEEEPLGPEFFEAERGLKDYLATGELERVEQALAEIARQASEVSRQREGHVLDQPWLEGELRRWRQASCV